LVFNQSGKVNNRTYIKPANINQLMISSRGKIKYPPIIIEIKEEYIVKRIAINKKTA